jgi:hypothetical protein
MPKKCDVCEHIQHAFFPDMKALDAWTCPVCEGRTEPNEIDIQEQEQKEEDTSDRNEETQDEVSDIPEVPETESL